MLIFSQLARWEVLWIEINRYRPYSFYWYCVGRRGRLGGGGGGEKTTPTFFNAYFTIIEVYKEITSDFDAFWLIFLNTTPSGPCNTTVHSGLSGVVLSIFDQN